MEATRHDWTSAEIAALFDLPFNDLLFRAQTTHRAHFDPNRVQLSTLMNIKTGGCAEDCGYCPQSAKFTTDVKAGKLSAVDEVIEQATLAKEAGATRFCMGAAWREPKDRDMEKVVELVKAVKSLGMESCCTLGMLSDNQAQQLADAGLDYYNHNLDTSPEYYDKIITTRTYQDRLDTLERVRNVGMKTCCGGIVGMGESRTDRVEFLRALATLPSHPESVPINMLVPVSGTPLGHTEPLDTFEWIRTIAVARLLMPTSYVRLSAGREGLNEQAQSLAYLAGANSIFYGEKLLTTPNPSSNEDLQLLSKLGILPEGTVQAPTTCSREAA
jgi:biotin synthase